MKYVLIFCSLSILTYGCTDYYENTIWTNNVSNVCIDSLIFKANNYVSIYSCELNYKFIGTYQISNDTVIVTEKDDSHGDIVEYFRVKYILINGELYPVSNGELTKSKWKEVNIKLDKNNAFIKSK
jgi:hypothetical protein